MHAFERDAHLLNSDGAASIEEIVTKGSTSTSSGSTTQYWTSGLNVRKPLKALQMPPKIPGRGQNIWTDQQRATLHLLHTQTTYDADTRATIFNYMFDGELKAYGVSKGLDRNILSTQYRERYRSGRERYWIHALRIAESEEEAETRTGILESVRDAAAAVGANNTSAPVAQPMASAVKAKTKPLSLSEKKKKKYWKGYATANEDDLDRLAKIQQQNWLGYSNLADESKVRRTRKRRAATEPPHNSKGGGAREDFEDIDGFQTSGDKQKNALEDDGTDENWSEEVGIDKEGGTKDHVQTNTSIRPPVVQLEMVHHSKVRWDLNRPLIDYMENASIPHSSHVYRHGGQVHRVTYNGGWDIDCMICDPNFCRLCNENADPSVPSQTGGLPFVHSSDTGRDDGMTVFQPKPKAHASVVSQGHLRSARFQSLKGVIRHPVRICGYVGCRVCSGSEHLRVQGNKETEIRELGSDEFGIGGSVRRQMLQSGQTGH